MVNVHLTYPPFISSMKQHALLVLVIVHFSKYPDVSTATCGQRAFSFSAPKLWNSLLAFIKLTESLANFKERLKTYLFNDHRIYSPISRDPKLVTQNTDPMLAKNSGNSRL